MRFGYIRVSTKGQNIDRQLTKLRALDIDERNIFIDRQSGKDFNRFEYQALKRMLRKGDEVYIDDLDRLGRDYDGIIKEWKQITREIGADIIIIDNESLFDSRKFKSLGDVGKLLEDQFLSLLSYVADQERKKILKRQKDGISEARKKGVKFGRKKIEISQAFIDAFKRWKSGEITAGRAMEQCGLKRNTFYRRVKDYENQTEVEG